MIDPFLISGPALISFSGGRTSAYMLWRILQAHGGTLPPDVYAVFANTGKEREETLRFVHECGERWGVPVHWVEWRDAKPAFSEVDFSTASRNGEPFSALIRKRGYLPNAVTRFCTITLKIQPMGKLMQSLGYERWINVVGLRHDEGHRCLKAYARNLDTKERWTTFLPLDKGKITKRDVMTFWAKQDFDLELEHEYEGNCDLCFLKSVQKKKRIIRDGKASPDWWIAQEVAVTSIARKAGARFVTEYSYADLAREVHQQPLLIDDDLVDEEYDTECGLHCAPVEDAA